MITRGRSARKGVAAPGFRKASFWELFVYEARYLTSTGYKVDAGISLGTLGVGLAIAVSNLVRTISGPYRVASILLVLYGAAMLLRSFVQFVVKYLRLERLTETDNHVTEDVVGNLRLSPEEDGAEYEVVAVADRHDAYLRSQAVDCYLFENSDRVLIRRDRDCADAVRERIRNDVAVNAKILRSTFKQARLNRRMFRNERKIGLDSTPVAGGTEVACFETDYFSARLTNERARFDYCDSQDLAVSRAHEEFPAAEFHRNRPAVLQELRRTRFSNNIGVSVLAITSDGELVLWKQRDRAMQSGNLIVPTGSGSVDYDDLRRSTNLRELLTTAMLRELREETTRSKGVMPDADDFAEVRILGYFRWLGRGGKPDFVGVARLDAPSKSLRPNLSEVVAADSRDFPTVWRAQSASDLSASIKTLLDEKAPRLSLPLVANLRALDFAMRSQPAEMTTLLWPGTS
ncbi:hypothetical protein ACIP5Y_39290 [Nocardia sp. NPDC088792]|uniref:hypothetical protein n=1 Tax=Nocardia sp. NPDC088792 TaxID=3364332 RepID=UPI0038011649